MAINLSPEVLQLIDRSNFAHLATLMPNGAPQSVPVWVGREGDHIVICTGENSLKGKKYAPRSADGAIDCRLPQSLRGSPNPGPCCRAPSRSRLENDGPHLAQVHGEALSHAKSGRTRGPHHRSRKSALHQTAVRTRTAEVIGCLRHRRFERLAKKLCQAKQKRARRNHNPDCARSRAHGNALAAEKENARE